MKNLHRIFIAVNLPDFAKKKLANLQNNWKEEIPAVWVKPQNLHITLIFLGNANDQEVYEICESIKKIGEARKSFEIGLDKIIYAPSPQNPRMIWAVGEKSKELSSLKNDLEKCLSGFSAPQFSAENKEFSPHITLCRLKQWQWRQINPDERPQIESDINIKFDVSSIEVMESKLKRGGAEYIVLESVELK